MLPIYIERDKDCEGVRNAKVEREKLHTIKAPINSLIQLHRRDTRIHSLNDLLRNENRLNVL